MVSGKNVTFRENSTEKSPSPKRFEEPEGMTDIDLRRLSELSGYSDSSVKKFDPNTVRNTLFKILAVFLFVGFGTMVFILIFRQEPIEQKTRAYNKFPNHPNQEYWSYSDEPSFNMPEISKFQGRNDETEFNVNEKDLPQDINLANDIESYEPIPSTNSLSQNEMEQTYVPFITINEPDQSPILNNEDPLLNNENLITNNKFNHDSNIIESTSVLNKDGLLKDNSKSISNDIQNSIIDFVSLNLEQLQKCKFEQTVETCCINLKTSNNDTEKKPCNVKEIVDEIKKREEEYSRIEENWLRKVLDNNDLINTQYHFESIPNLLELNKHPDKSFQSSAQDDEYFLGSEKMNFPVRSDLTQNIESPMQDESSNFRNIEYPIEKVVNTFSDIFKLDSSNQEKRRENFLAVNNLQPKEVHIRTPNLKFDAYKINVNDHENLPPIFLDDTFDLKNIEDSVLPNNFRTLNNIQEQLEGRNTVHDKNNEFLNLMNIVDLNKNDFLEQSRSHFDEIDDFDPINFFKNFGALQTQRRPLYLNDEQMSIEEKPINSSPESKISDDNLISTMFLFPFPKFKQNFELKTPQFEFEKYINFSREKIIQKNEEVIIQPDLNIRDSGLNTKPPEILTNFEDHKSIESSPKIIANTNKIQDNVEKIKNVLDATPKDNLGREFERIENAFLTKFNEISENIGDTFQNVKEKIKPAIQKIESNLIDIENNIAPKLKVIKDLPDILVHKAENVLKQNKDHLGIIPEENQKLKKFDNNGFHINIDPISILNRLSSNFIDNNNNEISSTENGNSERSTIKTDLKINHQGIEVDVDNLLQMDKVLKKEKKLNNGVTFQIIQKNENNLSPIIINGNSEGKVNNQSDEENDSGSEDEKTEYSTYETTETGPLQVTTKISKMETPNINKTDVKLDLNETNVNITYSKLKKVKRQIMQHQYPNIDTEQLPHLINQPYYYQNNPQNNFDLSNHQQPVMHGNYYNNYDQYGNENVFERNNGHNQNKFRHHGQFDYRGEEELGLDTQNLGNINQQDDVMNQNRKLFQEQNHYQDKQSFHPYIYDQHNLNRQSSFNEAQNVNVPNPNIQSSVNVNPLTEHSLASRPQVNNFGDHLLQLEHQGNFRIPSHNVNPPGSNINPIVSSHHIIKTNPKLHQIPQNKFDQNLSQQDNLRYLDNHKLNNPGAVHSINKPMISEVSSNQQFPKPQQGYEESNKQNPFGSPVSFQLDLPTMIKPENISDERQFNYTDAVDKNNFNKSKLDKPLDKNFDFSNNTMKVGMQYNENTVKDQQQVEENLETTEILEQKSNLGNAKNSTRSNNNEEEISKFAENKVGSQPTINQRISAETKMGQFNSASEDIQSSHHSSLNPNFQKQCIPISPPVGSSLSVIQQQMPYPYDPNLKYAQLIPINLPKPQANSFVINPQYTYVSPNVPQGINGYGTIFTNGQTSMVQQAGPSGQYYICNPITTTNNQVTGIPGVEVRQSGPVLAATLNQNLTTRQSDTCATGYELCADNSKCIKTDRICDGEVNCDDGSDEIYCSCKYRLGPSRWCDGYYDCPNGEDEAGCFGCESGFFNCDDWSYSHGSTCIPIHLRCNGIPDCPTGFDEQECSALLDTIQTSEDLFKVSNNAGFLHRNFEGKWYPVCTNPEYWALDACKYETGPSIIPPLTRLVPLEHQYTGEYASAGEDNEIHLATKCFEKRAVYVECPQPTCGIRWLYRNAYRREEIDTSAEEIAARFSLRSKRENNDSKIVDDLSTEDINKTVLKEQLNSSESILGDGRVVGGRPCQPGAWPWVVSIYKNGAFHCGGVLISDMWLMTAAHCTEKYWLYFYEIELGMLRRFSYSPMQQTRYVTDVISHPGYDRSNLKNDLAMMRLNHPVKFNRYVRPICLPNEYTAGHYYQNGPTPGTVCTAVGWGATVEHGSDPDHMREVEVPVLARCKHKEDEEGNEICAGLMEGGKDACQGDSGGPFLCRNPNMPEQWYLAGIVSHGEGCARPNEPGVYTKVAIYRDWIFENAKDDMLPQRKPLHHCPGYTCRAINKCIPKKRRCDRVIDCLNGDDEIDCEHGNSFSSLFKHAMKHMMFSYDGLSRSNVETPGNPQTAEAVPVDKISTTFKMENSPITDTLNGNGFAKDDSSFASPAPISDRDKFISNAEAATATSVDVTTEKESVDESPEESISPATVSNKEDATQPAKTDVNSTVMMKSFKGERFLCRKMLEVIPAEKKCDKTIDCQDGTDEESCACADYLKHSHPEAICDGVTDCGDLSDEKECNASCGGGHFYCRLSKACIPIEKKCDNRPDCDHNEDEWDCFTLADSHRVLLDADSRPALLRSGLLAFNKGDHWVPLCMNYTGIEGRIAADACVTQGFNDYEKYLQVEVPNRILRIGDEDEILGTDEKLGSCNALYIKCADVSVSGHEIGKEDRLNVAGELHTPPWNAAVYADGEYKCAGTVLNLNWILTSVNCFPGILKLHQHYVAVLMGAYKGYLHVGGPHEQVIPVTEAVRVPDTEVVLLRLKKKLRFTRYVHPLHFKRTGDLVRYRETCMALGRDSNQKSSSVLLRPVQNCTAGFRCFERLEEMSPECKVSDAADPWSGCVVCDSGSGFYPAAVFHEPKGRCGFSGSFSLPNIALLKRDIFQYIEKAEVLVQSPPCKGFRCNLGECIQAQSMCNGIPDCRDAADEDRAVCSEFKRNCHLTDSCYCSPSEMRCANGNCVLKEVFCDQIDDCGDGSDEPDICNCQTYLRLANSSKICDGVRNCLDKSDEDPTLCKCSGGQFKCGESSYCIPNDMVCDGTKDCPGNEDEAKCLALQSPDDNFNIGEVLTCTYGVWHPGCFPEHLTTTELEEICKKIGFSGNSASYLNTTATPTGRPVLDPFNSFWVHRGSGVGRIRLSLRSGDKSFVSFVDDPGCRRLFLRCL